MSFLDQLSRELTAVGIGGARRARILTEFADHLESDPKADLGDPTQLARQFADELGTALARRAAFIAFAGLAVAGILIAIAFVTSQRKLFAYSSQAPSPVGDIGAWLAVIGAQVALVAGGLAAVRAVWVRRAGVVPRAEAVTLVRRAAVGLGAGIVTMVGFGLVAISLIHHTATWWTTLAISLSGAGVLVLVAAAPATLSAARVRPVAAGPAGDLSNDLGPLMPPRLQGRPWSFALVVAALVAVGVALIGVAQSDPFDGMLRGVADALACLAGFGLLGRFLSLR